MADRPYTLLSCAMSMDGYLDDATDQRLLLSCSADFDRVDALRASCDAILVGAHTVRCDNPRLIVRDEQRRHARLAQGLSASPIKVTLTARGQLAPTGNFFTMGEAPRLVYCPHAVASAAQARLGALATIIDAGARVDMRWLSEDLHLRGVSRLLVEGGGTLYTQFLAAGLADELQLVVAPLFVGDSRARRFVDDGHFPWNRAHRAQLVEARPVGDVALLRYALSPRFQP